MEDCASPLVHLPVKGRAPSHTPASREPDDSTPSACSTWDDAFGLSLSPWGGSVSDSASCLPGPASPFCLALDDSRCFSAHLHRCLDAGCGQLSSFCSVTLVWSPQMQPYCWKKTTEHHTLMSNLRAKYQRKEAFSQGRCTTRTQHLHQGPGYQLFTFPCSRICQSKGSHVHRRERDRSLLCWQGLHITAGVKGAASSAQEHARERIEPSKGGQDSSYPLSQLPSKELESSASLQDNSLPHQQALLGLML